MSRWNHKPPTTLDEVASRRRHRAAEQERWERTIEEAAALHGLDYTPEGWAALAEWYKTVPKGLPSRRDQARWLRGQRVLASLAESTKASA